MPLPNTIQAPSLIQTFQFFSNPTGFLEKVAQRHPDIFSGTFFAGQPCVFIQHPQAIEEFFRNEKQKFGLCENKSVQALIGKYAITSLVGENHKRHRQLLMPSFHGERMRCYGQMICDLTEEILSQQPLGQIFSAHTMMKEISLEVMLKVVFGLYSGERYEKLKHLIPSMLNLLASPLLSTLVFFPFLQKDLGAWSPWGKFLRICKQVDSLLYAEIAYRRAKPDPERTDILSLLMEAKDQEGQSMTDQELRDQLITLLMGGHETTVSGMTWALYWAHRKPEVGEKLRQELNTLGNNPEPMTIFKSPYLTAVCNESLRYYHPGLVIFPRVVKQPVELLGYTLEPGTRVIACTYLIHHREDTYPQHKEFRPERFLEKKYSPYEFLPFGGGMRRCIGEALAIFEMKLVLASIISKYKLSLEELQPVQAKFQGFTLGPANGVKMMLKEQCEPRKSLQTVA
ncbi:cytochrome P450 [Mastigocoleus testarum]|uniref:Cytochrome P450 n=1 Tax=Mastigocoleus testarum BC008 TaxID=371196 RepID=A0A0V7ZH09_9CYAN|nr:cytochrome P450 [Mastigocoleus testarum]KST63730.1 cytochrome P450 [Mastigocoleus testarum BC008]